MPGFLPLIDWFQNCCEKTLYKQQGKKETSDQPTGFTGF